MERLHGATHTIIPDRIEAGTFLTAGALMGDAVEVAHCRPDHPTAVVEKLGETGARIEVSGESIKVGSMTSPKPANVRARACLVLAGLAADGATLIDRVYHLDRGYERIEGKQAGLGAEIERVTR